MHNDQALPPAGRLLLFVVVALLALVLGFVFASRALAPQRGASASPGASATTAASTGSGRSATLSAQTVAHPPSTTTAGALAGEADRCRLANLREQAALGSAAASLEQFQKHIDAMNLWVAGKISLAVATQFWDQSRVTAAQKAAAFRSADKAVTVAGAGCPDLGPTAACTAPLDRVTAITECDKAERARLVVLSRARLAVTTWEHHIHDMDMLMDGQITPSQATSRWQQNWKAGQKQVDTYSAAAQLTAGLHCPLS